ncbi:hypothetical protein [Streptomyces acidiscabies]|uniref:Uncharacterized protein n=1 Tax=Streptomyces acidiscabies TaxID=42234 RepID=A0A0L0JEB5_9ACTN|nr:hypothetical protein [Streptomyces acidiscabies]KND23685.1 hypothetical protein IQ63_43865 [Streptomyces acidiscabies]
MAPVRSCRGVPLPLPEEAPDHGFLTPDQIRADVDFLRGLGADHMVLGTDPGDQRLRWRWKEDLEPIRLAAHILGLG